MPFRAFQPLKPAPGGPRKKQLKGWRREKKLKLISTINPEFKDLAQIWGWKMITAHEKMYP
jgi:putative endonuclease